MNVIGYINSCWFTPLYFFTMKINCNLKNDQRNDMLVRLIKRRKGKRIDDMTICLSIFLSLAATSPPIHCLSSLLLSHFPSLSRFDFSFPNSHRSLFLTDSLLSILVPSVSLFCWAEILFSSYSGTFPLILS